MLRVKDIVAVFILCICSQGLYAQSYNIKKDITEAFQSSDTDALGRAMNGVKELIIESTTEPGVYVVDTLSVCDILSHIENISENITYDSNPDNRIAADLLYSLYSSIIGRYSVAISSSEKIVRFLEANPNYDRYFYCSILDMLSGYYFENQDYESSIKYSTKLMKHLRKVEDVSNILFYDSSMHIARSEFNLGNIKSAYKHIKIAYNHPDKDYLSGRLSINSAYVEILQSLASTAISKNNFKRFIEYYEELLTIFRDYPDINVSMLLEDEFIIGTFTSLIKFNYKKEEIHKYIETISRLRYESMARYNSFDYTYLDGIAMIVRSWGEEAINAEKLDIARLFFDFAYDMSIKGYLSYDVSLNINSWYAYFCQYFDNNHVLAIDAYKRSLDLALINNDKSTTQEYLKYILNIHDESISHLRYFIDIPKPDQGIFVLSFADADYILRQWDIISAQVISQFGEKFFTQTITSFKDLKEDYRVFPLYSSSDNKLMHAHNFIREGNYVTAFKLINELVNDETLNDDKIIEIIWRIDNNLYLNTGYKESDLFLQNVRESNFVANKSEVITWIDNERERIKNWLGYKVGEAHNLAETGNFEVAMETYDGILEQIKYLDNPDSLYVETQLMRAIDLRYLAENYNESLSYSREVYNIVKEKFPENHLTRSNALANISECLYKIGNYSEALIFCEENIELLNKYKVDDDGHHLFNVLFQYGNINMELNKYDSAEYAYRRCLKNSDETTELLLVTNIAKIYKERLNAALKSKNGELCFKIYEDVIQLYTSYPQADPGLVLYFSPLDTQIKDILAIINPNSVCKLCDDIIALDSLVNSSKKAMGADSEIHPLEWHANVIQCIASRFREMEYWREAILYHDKAIEFVIENDQHSWGSYMTDFYTNRAITKEHAGDWVAAIKDRILAFNSSQKNTAIITHEVEESFRELSTSINLALATKTSYAIAMYEDSLHPHLKYDECIKILELWRESLNRVLQNYGEGYLASLQNYIISASQKWFYERYNGPMQYSVTDQLTLLSGIDYMKCNLDINENRLSDFNQTFRKLLDNVEPLDKTIEVRKLRYDIVKNISSTLSHAGYTDWSFKVLEGYLSELITNDKDYELAEKINTEMGILAYNLGDFSRLMYYTRFVNTEFISDAIHNYDYSVELWPFYDINELIQQLMLLSRLQNYIGNSEALKTLYYAKELVDNNKCLLNGNHVTTEVAANLYNDLAIIEDEPQKSIEFYKKSLEFNDKFDYGTTLNLATEYMNVGNFSEADSLLHKVYEYSKEQYIEPRWKASLYKGLTKCSVQSGNYEKALKYSQERLLIQSYDYLQTSQSMTSAGRNNYWDAHYASTLSDASTTDLACGSNGSNSYNAALFQKSILIRQKSAIKNNIINCNDAELIQVFDKYNQEIRSHSDYATSTEEYCMYLYSLHPEFVSSFSVPRWQEIQGALNKRDLALEFTETFDENSNEYYYAAILLRKGYDNPVIVKLCKKNDLLSLNYNKVDGSGFSISMFEDQSALYQLIWEPLQKYLNGVKTIYYSPYEFLNNINMEAAKKKEGAKPIGFAHNMVRVSTTAELLSEQYTSFSNAAVFGDIDYDAPFNETLITEGETYRTSEDNYTDLRGSKHETWKRLVHAAREVEGINHLFRNNDIYTTNYTNDQGTEEAFKSLSGNAPDILHLATHGFYYTSEEAQEHEYFRMSDKLYYDFGVRSGIILTSGNHAWRGKSVPYGVEDGILTANEISGIDLSNTDLITLSACQTALGDIASDGVYGMQRSFKVAGVNSIIMSLWQVDDEATYLMMEKFYDELTKGKGKREAFRDAQLFIKSWADQRVKELKNTFSDKIPEIQEQMKAKYGALIYPEYYWAAFVMLD